MLGRLLPFGRFDYPSVSLLLLKRMSVVQESQPVVHRLRRYVLGLGPDLPREDKPSPGNLRFSAAKILTLLSLLMPAFSLLHRPPSLTLRLLPVHYAPLPVTPYGALQSFGGVFSPVNFRRSITRPVSYYALFE